TLFLHSDTISSSHSSHVPNPLKTLTHWPPLIVSRRLSLTHSYPSLTALTLALAHALSRCAFSPVPSYHWRFVTGALPHPVAIVRHGMHPPLLSLTFLTHREAQNASSP
ncbi:hypothetical protein PIB30_096246, partial [Stylosanthes scabra]|nr:hypothetical protein [Stylosanthes scabra]